jgi:hypothetical protein
MAEIPERSVTMADLIIWDQMKRDLAKLKGEEMLMRKRIAKHFFPNPTEGTHTHPLENGYVLKLSQTVDRKIDIGELQAATGEQGLFTKNKFDANPIVDWEPKLRTADYKKMDASLRLLFDNVMQIKNASPSMEIVLPAKNRPAS